MQDIHCLRKLDSIGGAVRIAVIVINDLKDPCPAKAGERLRLRVFLPLLGDIEGVTHHVLYLIRKLLQVHLRQANPKQGFSAVTHFMPLLAYIYNNSFGMEMALLVAGGSLRIPLGTDRRSGGAQKGESACLDRSLATA